MIKDYGSRHPARLNLKSNDTLPLNEPVTSFDAQLFDLMTTMKLREAVRWMKNEGRCWPEHVQRIQEMENE